MQNKTTTIIIGIVLIIAAFFGGKAYGASHAITTTGRAGMAGGYARTGGMGGSRFGGTAGGGATVGQVVSKDANSITVSIPNNGGSKIVLYSPDTSIVKSAQGAISDVAVGSTIIATGTTNSDGSITATSIQIRPTGTSMPQSGQGTGTTTSTSTAQ
jgi:hypothetical protein